MRRFEVSSDGTPEEDRAAELAQRLLDALPDDVYRRMVKEAARFAVGPLVRGEAVDEAELRLALEAEVRRILDDVT